MTTLLQSEADLDWLHETKHINVEGVHCAILHGNEDCPDKIECYYGMSISSPKRTYVYNEKTDTYDIG